MCLVVLPAPHYLYDWANRLIGVNPKKAGLFGKRCYKVLVTNGVDIRTPYRGERILFTGGKFTQDSGVKHLFLHRSKQASEFYYIDIGIHGFCNKNAALKNISNYCSCPFGCKLLVVKAKIPRGAEYYYGLDGEIVATKMILSTKSI